MARDPTTMERLMPARGRLHQTILEYLGPEEDDLDGLEMVGVRFVPCQMGTTRGQAGCQRELHRIGPLKVCRDSFTLLQALLREPSLFEFPVVFFRPRT